MTDPLHDALRDATLAVLLGSKQVPYQSVDPQGVVATGMITIGSAFESRIRDRAYRGDFDDLIRQAIDTLTPEDLVDTVKSAIAKQFLDGLESVPSRSWGQPSTPGWLQREARDIAKEACTAALSADEELLDTLRARIGAEVDRNRVGITVSLSDPESAP